MKASDDLHKLIQSLSKAEKRNFKLYVSRYDSGQKNNYIKLFEIIERQVVYDETELKEKLAGEKFLKHLPSEKNYLYNLLLESLQLQHAEESIIYKLKKRIHQAGILLKRGLTDQCIKLLKRVKESAQQKELHAVILEVLQIEKQVLTRNYYIGATQKDLDAIYAEEKKCIELMAETNEYWKLFSAFYRFHYGKGSVRDAEGWNQVKTIFSHPLLSDISKARTFQTRLDFLHIHALYYFMSGEPAKAYEYNKQQLAFLESSPERLKEYRKRYQATLNNLLMDGLNLGMYDEVERGIIKLRKLPETFDENTVQQRADIFRLSTILELNVILKRGTFESGAQRIPEMVKSLEEFENHIVKHNLLTIYYLFAYVSFGAQKYKDAVRWLNKIINDAEEDVLQDIHAFARIFSLIVHYELKNHDLMDYLNQQTVRYLNKRSKFYRAESILLKSLKKLSNITQTAKSLEKAFKSMELELQPLTSDPAESKAFEYFDIMSWVESKLSRKDFASVVKGKNLKS
ncbi:MAG: hypothetical protein ACXWDO_00435 [Bacteroidia bacterium]